MSMMQWKRAISFTIFAAIFSVDSATNSEKPADACNQNTQNVGTVLFHGGDMNRKCWEDCSYLLLQARWIAQTLIPRGKVNICNEAYISAFINYVESTLQTTKGMSKGLAQQMMVDVLADIHGGYLRAVLLPLTREAFYAGTVRYEEAIKLFKLYEDLKIVLRTDGFGWQHTLPPHLRQRLPVRHLDLDSLPKGCCEKACEDFIPYERCREVKSRDGRDRGKSTTQKGCITPCSEEKILHVKQEKCLMSKCCASTTIVIPIPFLDDNSHPHSIAVPLRPLSLHSLFTAKSQSLVTKYYKSAMRCLLARNATRQELTDYNRQFRRWLMSAVLPHLHDETFYPAFGSVMRIVETMHTMGFERVDQELLNSAMDEPPKVNSLRALLKAARLEGQGSWKIYKATPTKQRSAWDKKTCAPDDEDLSFTEKTTEIEEVEQCNVRNRLRPTESDEPDESPEIHGFGSWDIGEKNGITGKFTRGTMDILVCIILGMLGTLLLWLLCACCYCLISRIRGKAKGAQCYPKGDRCDVKPQYYGTTDDRSGMSQQQMPPPVQSVAYEYSTYDTRPMRSPDASISPYAGECYPSLCSPDPYQQPPPACRVIMMPPQEPPKREHVRIAEEADYPEPPQYRHSSVFDEAPPYREHSKSLRDYEELPLKIRRPPSIRQMPDRREVSPPPRTTKQKSVYPRGTSLDVIESMTSVTPPQGSDAKPPPPEQREDDSVSIPASMLAHEASTASKRGTRFSEFRGTRKSLPQQVQAPRLSNMPLGSW